MTVENPLEIVAVSAEIQGLEEVVQLLRLELQKAKSQGCEKLGSLGATLDDIRSRVDDIEARLSAVEVQQS